MLNIKALFARIWSDDAGSVIATEYLALASIVGLGTAAGLNKVKNSMNAEMEEFAGTVRTLNQSYSYKGMETCAASRPGVEVVNLPCKQAITP